MCVWAIYQLSIHVCLNYKSTLYICMAEVFISTVYMYGWSFYQHLIQVWRKYYQHCIHVWLNYLSALFTCMAVVFISIAYMCYGSIISTVYMRDWTIYQHCNHVWLNYKRHCIHAWLNYISSLCIYMAELFFRTVNIGGWTTYPFYTNVCPKLLELLISTVYMNLY